MSGAYENRYLNLKVVYHIKDKKYISMITD